MIRIIIFIAVIVFVIYLINYDNRLIKRKNEKFNDYGSCSESGNSTQDKDVYVLGKVGMSPWGECPGFLDQNANWIWFTPSANNEAPGKSFGSVSFSYNWYNIQSSNIDATINVIVDNQTYIKVNNINVGEYSGGYGTSGGIFNITLKPGENNFLFNAQNYGDTPNPAGLLVTVVDGNKNVLFSSGKGWKYNKKDSLNKLITSSDECSKAGGSSYNYCPDTGTHYCCGVCGETATCSSNSGLLNCACSTESSTSSTSKEDDCFDLNYMEKRRVLIAISSSSGNNTYNNTEKQCLGIATQDQTSDTSYKPSSNNSNNTLYSSVYVYTGKRGGLASNVVYQ